MKKIINDMSEFFLPTQLYIDLEKLDNNFYFFKETKEDIENFTHDDAINDWLKEKARIFNSSTFYLINSVEKMIVFWNNIENDKSIETWLRMEIRNTCINIEMYVDKIKNLIGYYFFFDEKTIFDGEKFIKALKQFETISTTIGEFIESCILLHSDKKYQWIRSIRVAEIHNESLIDRHNYEFSPNNSKLIIVDKGYKVKSEIILDNIQHTLFLLKNVRDKAQQILESIPPIKIYNFVKDTPVLKGIIFPGNRVDSNKKIIINPSEK